MPLFSIGVTTYDRVELLAKTLSSISSQTFADFEVIIGNDNPDRTITSELLGVNDERFRFVNHRENLGELNNMNELLRISRGRYFTWLADDDLYAPNLLSSVAKALDKFGDPQVVFTSFTDFRGTAVPALEPVADAEFQLMTGREFIQRYLSDQIKAIGVMGFFSTEYLRALGGLEDVSGDGMGFYCEYMILIRTALQERIAYINSPLVFYRIHEGAWGIMNSNLEQYDRAAKNLLRMSADVFASPTLEPDFSFSMRQLLKRVMIQYINVARASHNLHLSGILSYLANARKYISANPGRVFYAKAIWSLINAEAWIVMVLVWRKFLSTAPSQIVNFAFFLQSLVRGKRNSARNVTASQ